MDVDLLRLVTAWTILVLFVFALFSGPRFLPDSHARDTLYGATGLVLGFLFGPTITGRRRDHDDR